MCETDRQAGRQTDRRRQRGIEALEIKHYVEMRVCVCETDRQADREAEISRETISCTYF